MERPKISLIIPAYNEEKYIGRTLESVVKAKESYVRPHLIEVIKEKRFKIITSDYVISSTRVFDKFGDWYYFKHLPNFLLNMRKMARDKEFCDTFWYNIKR